MGDGEKDRDTRLDDRETLRRHVELQARRIRKARKERQTLLAQTTYLGTLGLLFVVPVAAGAYLGLWIDSRSDEYSVLWTITLLLLGVVIGALNVYIFIRTKG